MKLGTIILACSLACVSTGMVAASIQVYQDKDTEYHLTHTVVKCDGQYLVVQDNKDIAMHWAAAHCANSSGMVSYELVANQDYDNTQQ